MKIDNIQALLFALVRNDKQQVETLFKRCIADEKECSGARFRLQNVFEEYHRRQGMAVVEKLDTVVLNLVSAPYRDCGFEDLMLSEELTEATDRLVLEWDNRDYLIENGLTPSNKILLEGSPGNGKTSYAVALAKKLDLPLLVSNSSLILNSRLGESEKNVANLFRHLPERCVLLVDEFEAVASSRSAIIDGSASKAWNSIVTRFLVNMEALRPSCLFLAATNRSELLDKAVTRRFDMKLVFENPTTDEKQEYIDRYFVKYGLLKEDVLTL